MISALGTATGTLAHVVAATVGLSALLLSSATVFEIVKLAGAAYLIFLGLQRLVSREQAAPPAAGAGGTLAPVYRRAALVAALNPKTALFFVAFLPQFVRVGHGPVALQILFLGLVFVLVGLASDSVYAAFAGTAGSRLRPVFGPVRRYLTGTTLIGLGFAAARVNR